MIELAFPWALLLLPLPLLSFFLIPPYRQRTPALRFPFFREIVRVSGVQARSGSVVVTKTALQTGAAIVVWILIVVALARPERVGAPIEIEKSARDIMLAIDISGSMDQRDFTGNDGQRIQRLEAVKRVVGDFIETRDSDRVALIVFGTRAFVQSPFTEDLATVRALLQQTEVGMAGPQTVIGDAIGLSIRTFRSSEIEQRLLILLSDGADTGSRMSPVNAAAIAAQNGVEIITVAVGDPDGSGENRVDVAALEDISKRGNGAFFFADDEAGLASVYQRIDAMTPRSVETLSYRPREALGHYLLMSAALFGIAATAGLFFATRPRVTV